MKYVLVFILGIWALIGVIDAVVTATLGPDVNVFVYLGPAIVVAAAFGAYAIRRRQEIRDRSAEADSVERTFSIRARADAMVDGLIMGLVVGVVLLFTHGTLAGLLVFAVVTATAIDFSVRYAVLLRSSRE